MASQDRELARRIRAARGYAGLNQPGLAERLGVSAATVSRWERDSGDYQPSEPQMVAIARACGIEESYLLEQAEQLPRGKNDEGPNGTRRPGPLLSQLASELTALVQPNGGGVPSRPAEADLQPILHELLDQVLPQEQVDELVEGLVRAAQPTRPGTPAQKTDRQSGLQRGGS